MTHYATGPDYIAVQFGDPTVYIYDHVRPGRAHIESMKGYAAGGRGLCTYINKHVRQAYARKQQGW